MWDWNVFIIQREDEIAERKNEGFSLFSSSSSLKEKSIGKTFSIESLHLHRRLQIMWKNLLNWFIFVLYFREWSEWARWRDILSTSSGELLCIKCVNYGFRIFLSESRGIHRRKSHQQQQLKRFFPCEFIEAIKHRSSRFHFVVASVRLASWQASVHEERMQTEKMMMPILPQLGFHSVSL